MSPSSRLVVVDASVVLKWQFDDEECVSQALALRDDFYLRGAIRVIAPQLLAYELTNGIVVASRKKRISTEKAAEAMSNLLALGVELKEVESLSSLELALRYNLSAYDAAYVTLAQSEKCELWTGDKALYQAVKDEPSLIKWIGDYSDEAGTRQS
jgi:predicted nucleic acid-binding protein